MRSVSYLHESGRFIRYIKKEEANFVLVSILMESVVLFCKWLWVPRWVRLASQSLQESGRSMGA
jgi:hypothetical protein